VLSGTGQPGSGPFRGKPFRGNDPVGQDGLRVRPTAIQIGKLVEASSGSNPWVCLDWLGWEARAACLRVRGVGWKGPGGMANAVLRPSGHGSMNTRPLEQRIFKHGPSGRVFGLFVFGIMSSGILLADNLSSGHGFREDRTP